MSHVTTFRSEHHVRVRRTSYFRERISRYRTYHHRTVPQSRRQRRRDLRSRPRWLEQRGKRHHCFAR